MIDTLSLIFNAAIFIVTAAIVVSLFRKDGAWSIEKAKPSFRFYTVLSNVLCGIAALCVCVSRLGGSLTYGVWLFKYIATAAVTVTLMTVLLFLGPANGGYKGFFSGRNLYLHLLGPLLAIASFSLFEKRPMSFPGSLWGMVTVVLYGLYYLYRILYAPEEKRWKDFYGFNKGGKWPVAFAAMMLGGFAVCMLLRLLQNL